MQTDDDLATLRTDVVDAITRVDELRRVVDARSEAARVAAPVFRRELVLSALALFGGAAAGWLLMWLRLSRRSV